MRLNGLVFPFIFTLLHGCAPAPAQREGRVSVGVQAVSLQGVTNVVYTLSVTNAAGRTVWTQQVDSATYGNGSGGDLTYVGPCDAGTVDANGVAVNTVTLTIDAVQPLNPSEWANPGPMVQQFTCRENADTGVEFNVTILRSAGRGFTDISVNFEEIFCSAKVDCQDAAGEPLKLVFDKSGERGPTVVIAVACTSGRADEPPPTLYLKDLYVQCKNGENTQQIEGAVQGYRPLPGPVVTGQAGYFGVEALEDGTQQLYVTRALAVGSSAAGWSGHTCRLMTQATAAARPFEKGALPEGTWHPVIDVNVPLTGPKGELACGHHPLLGGNGVDVFYSTGGTSFAHAVMVDASHGVVTVSY